MNGNLDTAVAAINILCDEARTPIERYKASMMVLDGVDVTSLADGVRQKVEFERLQCTNTLDHYSIASSEDFDQVSDVDAHGLVSHALDVANTVRDAAIETVMARLHHHERRLPVSEIETARRHRELFTPILLQVLQERMQWWRDHPLAKNRKDDDSNLPFFTFMLMFEWEEALAVPLIFESLQLPGEATFDLYGDIVHEFVHRFLAYFFAEKPDDIEALIRNSQANIYVRWVACRTFHLLVLDSKMKEEDAAGRLTKLFFDCRVIGDDGRPGIGHCYEVSAAILDALVQLGGANEDNFPNTPEIWDYVDESITTREYFYQGIPDELQSSTPTRVEDCLSELGHWAAFDKPPVVDKPVTKPKDRPRLRSLIKQPLQSVSAVSPQRSTSTRIGRNDLCPCGSGKKYKKCCLRTSNS